MTKLMQRIRWLREKYSVGPLNDSDIRELLTTAEKLHDALEIAADQLDGVSIAITRHGQNIDVHFFIREYCKMAKEAREAIGGGE